MFFGIKNFSLRSVKCVIKISRITARGIARSPPGIRLMPITRAQANSRLRTSTAVNLAAFRFNSQLNESRRVSRTLVDVSSAIPSGSTDPQPKASSETVDTAADVEAKTELFAVELHTGAVMAATSLTEKSLVKGAAVIRAKKSTKAAALPSVAPDRCDAKFPIMLKFIDRDQTQAEGRDGLRPVGQLPPPSHTLAYTPFPPPTEHMTVVRRCELQPQPRTQF